MVFNTGGSLSTAQSTLDGQAQKAIFTMNKYLNKLTYIPPKHKLELFDKLVSPILNYCCEICCFANDLSIDMRFCKKIALCEENYSERFYAWRIRQSIFLNYIYNIKVI